MTTHRRKTLNHGMHLSSKALKERSLQCFGVPAHNAAALQGVPDRS